MWPILTAQAFGIIGYLIKCLFIFFICIFKNVKKITEKGKTNNTLLYSMHLI
jgi:hypothetical protein